MPFLTTSCAGNMNKSPIPINFIALILVWLISFTPLQISFAEEEARLKFFVLGDPQLHESFLHKIVAKVWQEEIEDKSLSPLWGEVR